MKTWAIASHTSNPAWDLAKFCPSPRSILWTFLMCVSWWVRPFPRDHEQGPKRLTRWKPAVLRECCQEPSLLAHSQGSRRWPGPLKCLKREAFWLKSWENYSCTEAQERLTLWWKSAHPQSPVWPDLKLDTVQKTPNLWKQHIWLFQRAGNLWWARIPSAWESYLNMNQNLFSCKELE